MVEKESRRFFRIQCNVALQIEWIDKPIQPANVYFKDDPSADLHLRFHKLDDEITALGAQLKTANETLDSYLKLTQQKMNTLESILLSQNSVVANLPQQTIELSEAGLAFRQNEAVDVNSLLALRFFFLPEYQCVTCVAEVVRCDNTNTVDEGSHKVAVEFKDLPEQQLRLIAKMVMKAQRSARRIEKA